MHQASSWRTLAPKPGPEADLIAAALQHPLPEEPSGKRILFFEPNLPTGFPDIVAVYPRRNKIQDSDARKALTHYHLRFLHQVFCCKSATYDDLSKMLFLSDLRVRELADELSTAKLVRIRGNRVLAGSVKCAFATKRIVAVEAKVSNWKCALRQASANTWFASHSYVLLPQRKNTDKIVAEARLVGVGVLMLSKNNLSEIVPPVERPIPASYGSWMFSEWACQRISEGDKND